MPLLPRLRSLWRNLFRKARKEQELTEEIDAYLEMLIIPREGFLRTTSIWRCGRRAIRWTWSPLCVGGSMSLNRSPT